MNFSSELKQPCVLYVHVPFCQKKCFFCSFAVYAGGMAHVDHYLDLLEKESKKYFHKKIKTVYIGGGTPTLLSFSQIQRLLTILQKNFFIEKNCEFTVETNPETMDIHKARLLKSLGVNRISIGAQSLSDVYLKFLGRTHRLVDIKNCFSVLRKVGFKNINMDVMFGFPGQTPQDLGQDVRGIVNFGSEHLSVYALTVEAHSKFYTQSLRLPSSKRLGMFYQGLIGMLEDKGFRQYEISNFAKPGFDSQHNRAYWNCEDYIGLGPGAHSHIQGRRHWNISSLPAYLRRMSVRQTAQDGQEILIPRRRLIEALVFGLRMNQGVDLEKLERRFGVCFFKTTRQKIEIFAQEGFFMRTGTRVQATLKGRLVLDELSARLI